MGRYESPKYTVNKKDGRFELREYESFSTTFVKEVSLSGYKGFRVLFEYIGGSNLEKEKMSMTVPVINAFDEGEMTMEFVVPSKYGEEHIPKPDNPLINIKHYPKHKAAVFRFSGRINEQKTNKYLQNLKNWIEQVGCTPVGQFRLFRFNPPFIPSFLKHHELSVEVEEKEKE